MEEINIRPAQKEDLPTLLKFEQGVIIAERPMAMETLKESKINYYDIAAMIDAKDVEILVAELDGQLVGSGYARIVDSKPYLKHAQHCYLGFMFVPIEYRGKGINQLIINRLKKWSISQNIHELRLEVYHNNPAAIRAYEKAGFSKNLLEMRIGLKK